MSSSFFAQMALNSKPKPVKKLEKTNIEKYKAIMLMKQKKTACKDHTGSSSSALSLISASVGPNALSQRPRVLSLQHSEYVLICPNKHLTIAAAKLKTKEDSEIENINHMRVSGSK
ncbi:unnamed protein product [Amoebophrya sp. A120]|nr:unnamed protein product [Amoebophrya sp. A120]|eukprot:GSA120T00015521001.1